MLKRWVLIVSIGLFITLILMRAMAQDAITLEILNLVNRARAQAGAPALVINGALVAAAQRHSDDMAFAERLSHVGSDNSQFWERAAEVGYVMSAGAENVLSRFDTNANGVYEQWRSSEAHNQNMLNPAFQEVGIAYQMGADGQFYFTMVLGAREGFIPAPIASPTPFSVGGVASSTPFIIVPSKTPITMLVAPTRTPFNSGANSASVTLTPAGLNMPVVTPDALVATLMAPLPTNTIAPVFLTPMTPRPNPTQPPSVVMPSASATPTLAQDLRFIYDATSFTLVNTADKPLYLRGLVFRSASGVFDGTRWDTGNMRQSLESFRADDCLMIWGIEASQILNAPSPCKYRQSWVAVNDNADFWRDADSFSVEQFGRVLGQCSVVAGRCEVSLTPDEAGQGNSASSASGIATSAPSNNEAMNPASSGVDIQLITDSNGVALVNVSGGTVDLSRLAFEGDGGVFLASQWNTPNLTRRLDSYPNNDCLQVWGVNSEQQAKPSICRFRHAWVAVSADEQFWALGTYRVRWDAQVLATCGLGICNVSLP